jgi:hypothetical protein
MLLLKTIYGPSTNEMAIVKATKQISKIATKLKALITLTAFSPPVSIIVS